MLRLCLTRDLAADEVASRLCFVRSEFNLGKESIGFVPWPALLVAHDLGRLLLLERNNDPVGALYFGFSRTSCKIYQTWVRSDARVLEHGRALVEWLSRHARTRSFARLRLWCAEDLPAMLFWSSLGFEIFGRRVGGKSRGRTHVGWVRPTRVLSSPLLRSSSEQFSVHAGCSDRASRPQLASASMRAPRPQRWLFDPS